MARLSPPSSTRRFLLVIVVSATLLCVGMAWFVLRVRSRSARGTSGESATEIAAGMSARESAGQTGGQPSPRVLPSLPGEGVRPLSASRSRKARLAPSTLVPEDEISDPPPPRTEVAERGVRVNATPREQALRRSLQKVTAAHPGVDIMFVNCEGEHCRARAQASEPDQLNKFLADARRAPLGSMEIRVRERLTAFNGRTFQADIKLAGASPPAKAPAAAM